MKSGFLTKFLVILVIVVFIIGCKKKDFSQDNKTKDKATTIITSFYPMYIMTLNVTKDIQDVKIVDMIKPQTGCLHDYQLVPDDLKCLEQGKIFVINGVGMESFMDKITKQMPNLKIVEVGKGIDLIKGDGNEEDNPHLWVSISNAITQVKNIGEQLSILDSKNASIYKKNVDDYVAKLGKLKTKMHGALDNLKNRDIITFHEAFPYFAKEFNLNIVGVIEREPGSEPSAKELSDTVKTIKKLKVKALFAEPQYPAKAIDTIAKETGLRVYSLDPAVTGDMNPDSYINIMEKNLPTLQEALK